MLRKLLILIAVICIFVLGIKTYGSSATTASKVQEARKGVVMVYCQSDKNEKSGSMGSGFVIGKIGGKAKYVVTSMHVIAENTNGVSVVVSRDMFIKAKPVITNTAADFAVLELESELSDRIPLPLELSKNVSVAQKVYALGFPGAAAAIEDKNTWGPNDVTVSSGIISKELTVDGIATYQVDVSLNPGNSGGPLITEDGAVIGIARFTVKDAANINGVVKIDEIISSLDSLNIPYKLYGDKTAGKENDKSKTSSEDNKALENKSPDDNKTESNVNNGDKDTDGSLPQVEDTSESAGIFSGIYIYIIITIITIILIAGVIVIVLGKRKRKALIENYKKELINETKPELEQLNIPQSNKLKKVSIYCVSGWYSNKSFNISEHKLIIGRDYNFCSIVYPKDIPGISSIHCEISYNTLMNKCMIIDKGSTYGTFLANGEKLIEGKIYYLNISDKFYLASIENMFEIRES